MPRPRERWVVEALDHNSAIDPREETRGPAIFLNGSSLDLPLLRLWTLVTVAAADN